MPLTDSDRLKKIQERKAQLEKQEKAIINREKEKARKIETRRKIIVGGMFLKYFPDFATLTPQKNNSENDVAFASLAKFLTWLARDKKNDAWAKSAIKGE